MLETGAPASGVSAKISQELDGASRLVEAEERIVRLMLAINRAVRDGGGRLVVIETPSRNEVLHDPRLLDSGIDFFDTSCFSGKYVTGDISRDYLDQLEVVRSDYAKVERDARVRDEEGAEDEGAIQVAGGL